MTPAATSWVKLRVDYLREKEAIRNAVRITIRDFLWNDQTGLPTESYAEEEIDLKTDAVFRHIYWAYPRLPSPIYSASSLAYGSA